MSEREAILQAVYEADRLHVEFDTRSRAESGEGRVDVFEMFVARDIKLMFRPLDNLLGAFLPAPDARVLVTSRRSLPIQRFTAAHELGHCIMGHGPTLDEDEILTRALFAREQGFDVRELQANAFASQLLTPAWLIAHHMRRQNITAVALHDPRTVYQLSLRMGSSYEAMCYALSKAGAINGVRRARLLQTKPKAIKQSILSDYTPANWYGDVWVVTTLDDGDSLQGSRSDLVVLNLDEHASAGYLWQFDELGDAGFAIRRDTNQSASEPDSFGSQTVRRIVAEPKEEAGASGEVQLSEVRPWVAGGEPMHSLHFHVDFSGPIRAGLLPVQRRALLVPA